MWMHKFSSQGKLLNGQVIIMMIKKNCTQWCCEGNGRPGADLNFAPSPLKKFPRNDIEMPSIQLIMCKIIAYMYILRHLT